MATDARITHAEAIHRLRALMTPAPRPRAVWAGWWYWAAIIGIGGRHQTFKDSRAARDRRVARLTRMHTEG